VYGKGDSPLEYVGGSSGFAEFLEVMANPEHEDDAWLFDIMVAGICVDSISNIPYTVYGSA